MHQIETLLKPIEKQTLARTVLDRLLLVVRNGDFRPGQPLPSQHEHARSLSVSRPVLWEAMQALAAMREHLEIAHGWETRINGIRRELALLTPDRQRPRPSN